jgi:DNA-binding winged helix-turn-helix (wHTH) protein
MQVFDLLVHLVQNRDRAVRKTISLALLCGGRAVANSTLASRINAARQHALG